ncbi:MAG: ribonuclease H-like domain-containing protein [Anaerolineaceae bacterium]|nr:ribonuclease H-like domain-containing protein [Anaerolineaceae bacterium]
MPLENNFFQQDLFHTRKKMLAFDIETEDIDDFSALQTVGITCAATLTEEGEAVNWYGGKSDGTYAARMSQTEAVEMVDYLWHKIESGYQIYTWNGLAFDFSILYGASGRDERCKEIARSHVDMMFHFFCMKGFAISMEKAAQGMGLEGKLAGMQGSLAPKMWREGRYSEVLVYVAQDAKVTLDLARAGNQEKTIRWVSRRGRTRTCALKDGWLPVERALQEPEPDVSWMDSPWPRSRFTGWLDA